MTTQLSANQIAAGLVGLHDQPVIGIVLDPTYEFDAEHATAAALAGFEVEGSAYERATATARVERIDGEWILFLDGMTAIDLTDSPRSGIYWVRTGASDAARAAIGFAPDPGDATGSYLPTWDDGFASYPVESLNARLTALEAAVDDATDHAGLTGRAAAGSHPAAAIDVDGTPLDERLAELDTTGGLLAPTVAAGAPTAAGAVALIDIGSAGVDYEAVGLGTGVIGARAWSGLRIVSQMVSTVGSSYPEAGFDFRATGVLIAPRAYFADGEWIELQTVHAYSDGDLDETHDYLEIGCVQDDPDLDTLRIGIDLRLNGVAAEYTWKSSARPVRFGQTFDLRLTLDPATAEITLYVDDVEIETGTPGEDAGAGDPPSTPCALSVPASTVDILTTRGAVVVASMVTTEFGDTDELIAIDASDGVDGDVEITSGGRTWTSFGGRVSAPYSTPRLVAANHESDDPATWDLGAGDSATWVLTAVRWQFGETGLVAWFRDGAGALSGGSGWALAHGIDGLIEFGFGIADGTLYVAEAGAIPTGPCTVAAVLDRAEDELRLYIWTAADGLTLADTVDVSALGAVATTEPASLSLGLEELAGHAAFYRRALTPAEITYLAQSAPSMDPVEAAGGALDDGAVTTPKLAAGAVTLAKMADVASARFLGRLTAGSGAPEALTAAQVRAALGTGEYLPPTIIAAAGWRGYSSGTAPAPAISSARWFGSYVDLSRTATGGWIEWERWFDAGTWTLRGFYDRLAGNGVCTISVDGVDVGTFDQWNATTLVGQSADLTGITIASSGLYLIRSTVTAGGNGVSTNASQRWSGFQTIRTA